MCQYQWLHKWMRIIVWQLNTVCLVCNYVPNRCKATIIRTWTNELHAKLHTIESWLKGSVISKNIRTNISNEDYLLSILIILIFWINGKSRRIPFVHSIEESQRGGFYLVPNLDGGGLQKASFSVRKMPSIDWVFRRVLITFRDDISHTSIATVLYTRIP